MSVTRVAPIGFAREFRSTASPQEWLLGEEDPRIARQAKPQHCPEGRWYPRRIVSSHSHPTSGAISWRTPSRSFFVTTTVLSLLVWQCGQPLPHPRPSAESPALSRASSPLPSQIAASSSAGRVPSHSTTSTDIARPFHVGPATVLATDGAVNGHRWPRAAASAAKTASGSKATTV